MEAHGIEIDGMKPLAAAADTMAVRADAAKTE
jgi:hypothetical protein